jgi:TolB-like protein/Tfp pilus assembly protein PilF
MSEPTKAVFLSYASQDAEAARRICDCLRATGIEVWFDQSELRGGDAWDHKIRQQIHDCGLFMPIISAHSDERSEGYFRLEWKLAVDRSFLMADDAAFLFPVVIDGTGDASARVPERFRSVQWTRLPAGEVTPAFCQRVSALLAGTAKPAPRPAAAGTLPTAQPPRSRAWKALAAIAVLAVGALGFLLWREMTRSPNAAIQKVVASVANKIPAHSIAVLPFADLSARKDQDYFSDGLAEELLNLLSKVPGLQVAGRTSAFSFKGHAVDIPTIGRQLMVANVLEGSVRRVGNHLRVTAQLERADNGYQIWSETYDRELGDVFHMQDEIASAVVKALKVSLLGAEPPKSTGTQSSDAYLVFLQGRAKFATQRTADVQAAADDFARVLKLDPNYSPAYVELADAKMQLAEFGINANRRSTFEATYEQSKVLIEQALALDPKNSQAYIVRGNLRAFNDLAGAEQDYRHAIALNPNSARGYGAIATLLFEDPKRRDEVLTMLDRAHQLDPLEPKYEVLKGLSLIYGRSDFRAADVILTEVVARNPLYLPGLTRLADLRQLQGRFADSAMYYERAVKLDPQYEWARQGLLTDYHVMGDLAATLQVVDEAPNVLPVRRLLPLLLELDWHQAATVSYAAMADDTLEPIAEGYGIFAVRMDAHKTGDYRQARAAFEKRSGVTWSANGIPTLPTQTGMASASVALADMLIASGDKQRGERLLRASLADIDYIVHDLKRGDFWYLVDEGIAYALLGDRNASLAALGKSLSEANFINLWRCKYDPVFDPIRADPAFQAIIRQVDQKILLERQNLDRLRAAGQIPDRRRAPPAGAPTPRKLAATS